MIFYTSHNMISAFIGSHHYHNTSTDKNEKNECLKSKYATFDWLAGCQIIVNTSSNITTFHNCRENKLYLVPLFPNNTAAFIKYKLRVSLLVMSHNIKRILLKMLLFKLYAVSPCKTLFYNINFYISSTNINSSPMMLIKWNFKITDENKLTPG